VPLEPRENCASVVRLAQQHHYEVQEAEIAEALSPIGLQRQRAHSIKALAQYLVEHEKGEIPRDLESLLSIPGVGEYSARAILSFAFNLPAAVVDSNVERIFQRVFLTSLPVRPSQSVYQEIADRLLPSKQHRVFNWGLLDLGALVCRPGVPRCDECPLTDICDYYALMRATKSEAKAVLVKTPGEHEVPSRLRAARKSRSMSLVELSKRSGVSKLTIIKAESGRSIPQITTMSKLAEVLGIPLQDLCGN
jgi:adenine-specific DNA glycosylase